MDLNGSDNRAYAFDDRSTIPDFPSLVIGGSVMKVVLSLTLTLVEMSVESNKREKSLPSISAILSFS